MVTRSIFILLFGAICPCHAQEDRPLPALIELNSSENEPREHIFFQTRAPDPIIVDVRRDINKVSLVAKNTAFYPYTLTVRFNKIRNLVPSPDSIIAFIVPPGVRVLLNLRIFDPSQSFDFNFKVDKKIGDSGAKPVLDFPYLMPIAENRAVAIRSRNLNDSQDLEPVFALKKDDTVHAMRKGVITALPVTTMRLDRIASNSIEIRHMDGTIMVYENIDPAKLLVAIGESVYPGQPLCACGSSELFVSLYDLHDEKLKELQILFYINQDSIIPFSKISDGQNVRHPRTIIEKEMTKREIRRMKER